MEHEKFAVVSRKACPLCGSRDNVAVYANGGEHCFSVGCEYHKHGDGTPGAVERTYTPTRIEMSGQIADITDRRISKKTCEKFGVTVDYDPLSGKVRNHWYPAYSTKTGELTASKKRIPPTESEKKSFRWSGDRTDIGLFGQKTCSGRGKYLTITEGECDALAVSEMFDNKWDVVSLNDGCDSAARDIKANLEFCEGYDHVVLCFDSDEAGLAAVDAVKDLFTPNKVKVCTLPLGDANAMLMAGRVRDFTKAWWDAKAHSPDGIVFINETLEAVRNYKNTPSVPYPWPGLTKAMLGQRTGEVVVWAADSGIGKSQAMREVVDGLLRDTDEPVGCLMLEESIAKTTLGWMSFKAGRPLHKELDQLTDEEIDKYWHAVADDNRLVLLEHNGWNNDFDKLKSRIRYMAKGLGCRRIILDHLHYCLSSVSGATGDWAGIDELVTQLVQLCLECDITIHLVCHISEDRSLRGSKGIKKLCDALIFLERDPHHEDPIVANTTTVVIDKNRWAGDLGVACYLYYDPATGRMVECAKPEEAVVPDEF